MCMFVRFTMENHRYKMSKRDIYGNCDVLLLLNAFDMCIEWITLVEN